MTHPQVPLPPGFGIVLDAGARELAPGVWFGGQPARVLRLSAAGAAALARLRQGPVRETVEGRVARRLTDAGLAHPVPPAGTASPEVTVVVPVLDRPAALERCLASLGGHHPVVVVDDGSVDEWAIRETAARHGASLVRHARNRGPAAARNTGLAHVRTPLVAFVDSDTEPGADWLDPLAAHLADPGLAAVAPRVVPRAAETWSGRYTRARGPLDLGTEPALVLPYTRVSYLPSAALLARRDDLLAVAAAGGADGAADGEVFDTRLRVGEDVDLVWRLVATGRRMRYEPTVRVPHDEPDSWPALLRRRFCYGTSAAALGRRHPGNVTPLVLYPWHTAAVAALLARRPLLALAAAAVADGRARRALRRAGVPTAGTAGRTVSATARVFGGTGRYAVHFAWPALAVALARGRPRTRAAAAALTLAPAVQAWWGRRDRLHPVPFVAGAVADDIAYGTGVIAGCARARSVRPLLPDPAPLRIR